MVREDKRKIVGLKKLFTNVNEKMGQESMEFRRVM